MQPLDVQAEWLEPVSRCPVCGSEERETLADEMRDINYGGVSGKWRFLRCLSCQSAYMDPRIDEAHIAKAYGNYDTHASGVSRRVRKGLGGFIQRIGDAYTYRRYGLPGQSGSWLMSKLAYLLPPLRLERDLMMRHAVRSNRAASVLDVGCGNGDFLVRMRDAGWSAHGVDFDPEAVNAARSSGLDVALVSAQSIAGSGDTYDVVTSSHVIEHVHDPKAFLQTLFDKVKPGGVLWLVTPNISSPLRKVEGEYWNNWETPRHLQIFNVGSLRLLIEKALGPGCEPVFRRRGWHIYWSMAQSSLLRKGQMRGERPHLSRLSLPFVLGVECAALLSPRWGDEIIVEVRKPSVP